MLILIYLVIGALTGLVAGLLGVGGGLIVVPSLFMVMRHYGMGGEHVMHIALGTSLATIMVTGLASTLAHQRRHAIIWGDFSRFAPGLVLGALGGALLVDRMPEDVLSVIFGVFVILIALKMLLQLQSTVGIAGEAEPYTGFFVGMVSAFTGIGGGSMTVPYLLWKGRNIRNAIATSAACGLPISIAASAGFIWAGRGEIGYATGYIYLPAFFGIIATSMLAAPLGARLAHSLPMNMIRIVFSLFLFAVGIKILVF